MLTWFVQRLAVAVAAEIRRTAPNPPPVEPYAKSDQRLCRVRVVEYQDGTVQEEHSRCRGVPVDLSAMWTADAKIIKDTAHEWAVS